MNFQADVCLTPHQDFLLTGLSIAYRVEVGIRRRTSGIPWPEEFSTVQRCALGQEAHTLPAILDHLEALVGQLGLPDECLWIRVNGCSFGYTHPDVTDLPFAAMLPTDMIQRMPQRAGEQYPSPWALQRMSPGRPYGVNGAAYTGLLSSHAEGWRDSGGPLDAHRTVCAADLSRPRSRQKDDPKCRENGEAIGHRTIVVTGYAWPASSCSPWQAYDGCHC